MERLVVERRCDTHRTGRRPGQCDTRTLAQLPIGVGIDGGTRERIDSVDETPVRPIPAADAKTEDVGEQRAADRRASFVARSTPCRR